MSQVTGNARVTNAMGVHARPASAIVTTANRFDAEVELRKDGVVVNAKSIMGVLMLAAERGSTLQIVASGTDAVEAVEELVELIEGGFPGLDEV